MLNPKLVESRFQDVLETINAQSSKRIQMLRIVEFFEVLLETKSNQLILEYAPVLIVRLSRIVNSIEFTEENIGIADRLSPILWSFAVEYNQVGNTGICLAMLRKLAEARMQLQSAA
ncbi:MAG: hypothetical protein KF749_11485 [Bacteroidetes bacterium]|nr:hypothetical protein [Bacteroidota bacterium]MCW5895863.1 hypothetical protein [Bacteroidota bacterium]